MLTRRGVEFGAASILISGCTGLPDIPFSGKEQFTDTALQKIGQNIENWKVSSGVRMVELFDEARKSAQLLQGQVDPRGYFPVIKLPLRYSKDAEIGALVVNWKADEKDSRLARVIINNQTYEAPWLAKTTQVAISISSTVQGGDRLVVATHLSSQITDLLSYYNSYILLLRKGGASFNFINPKRVPTTPQEVAFNFGRLLEVFESQNYGYSSLIDFITVGSRLRITPMAVSWYRYQSRLGQSFQRTKVQEITDVDNKFLLDRNLITDINGVWKWRREIPVDSEEFFRIFTDYASPMRKVLIAPR